VICDFDNGVFHDNVRLRMVALELKRTSKAAAVPTVFSPAQQNMAFLTSEGCTSSLKPPPDITRLLLLFYVPVAAVFLLLLWHMQALVHGCCAAQALAATSSSRGQAVVAARHVPSTLVGHDCVLAEVPGHLAVLPFLVFG
jgi:hypothetical protein